MSEGTQVETRAAEGRIELPVPVERVWRALTEAAELERWFPLEARVEPGAGGRIWMSWGNEYGAWSEIRAWDPPHHLAISWKFGEEPVQVTDYRLEGRGGSTRLRVVTSGIPAGAAWDDLVEGTRLGWAFELIQLRHYLERHEGKDRSASYIRRRVRLPRPEIWARVMGGSGDGANTLGLPLGEVVERTPQWQLAAVLRQPAGGLARITVDPTHEPGTDLDVAVWLAAWGGDGAAVDGLARSAADRLAALFPEGRTLEAAQ
jgi:uncharacterized protein YndB with AHSA1/START domain